VRTVSVLKKTTVYDTEQKQGYTREEIFLLINPALMESEGAVHRLEKCGDEPERLLVTRPHRVRVRADRLARTITPEELAEIEMTFVAPTAYDVAHELEHLQSQKIEGAGIWELWFV
jgi:predicted metalloprotease